MSRPLEPPLAEPPTYLVSLHARDGTFLYASAAFGKLLGYAPDELLGRNAFELFHPEDVGAVRSRYEWILDRASTASLGQRIRRKDGRYVRVEAMLQSIPDPRTGAPREVLALSRTRPRTVPVARATETLPAGPALNERMRALLVSAAVDDLASVLPHVALTFHLLRQSALKLDASIVASLETIENSVEHLRQIADEVKALAENESVRTPVRPIA